MDVGLEKRSAVASDVAAARAVPSDVHATAACLAGAAITEPVDAMRDRQASKVWPAGRPGRRTG